MNYTNVTIEQMQKLIQENTLTNGQHKALQFVYQFQDVCNSWIHSQMFVTFAIPILHFTRMLFIFYAPEKYRKISIFGNEFWITKILDIFLGICIIYQTYYILSAVH